MVAYRYIYVPEYTHREVRYMHTILVVDDELGIRQMTKNFLQLNGFDVITAENGKVALEKITKKMPDLILLDIEMPEMDGFDTCNEIRRIATIPIIFITVRRSTIDKVTCLELGGDDYVTKPFHFDELLARIQANLRRYHTYVTKRDILTFGPLEIHLHRFECYLDGELIPLSTKEMEILLLLATSANQVWGTVQIYNQIWDIDGTGNIDTVKVHISYLRKKLHKPNLPSFIQTVHGFGYVFSFDD